MNKDAVLKVIEGTINKTKAPPDKKLIYVAGFSEALYTKLTTLTKNIESTSLQIQELAQSKEVELTHLQIFLQEDLRVELLIG